MGGPFSFRYMSNTNILLKFYPPSKSEQFVLLLYLKSDSFRLFNKNKDIDLYTSYKNILNHTLKYTVHFVSIIAKLNLKIKIKYYHQ